MATNDFIGLSPELLKARANEVRNLAAEYDATYTRLKSIVESLNEIWKGPSQQDMYNIFRESETSFKSVKSGLENYAVAMEYAVTSTVDTDQNVTNKNRVTLESAFR